MSVFATLPLEKALYELRTHAGAEPIVVDGKLVAVEVGLLRIAATTGVGLTIFEKEAEGKGTRNDRT